MPQPGNEMNMYEDMLDKLASEYPELAKQAEALSAKMTEVEPSEVLDEEEDDLTMMPGTEESIPPELMDEEEAPEEEEEYSL